ncbi:cytochrome P460 family protein [Anderseniella sp. Alg231-50]|uniref:cytochrome P460 family protein n=1 Tax=Anderseniella sp. Alg231-50 TaxID=1922226 RepID=UPI000D562730
MNFTKVQAGVGILGLAMVAGLVMGDLPATKQANAQSGQTIQLPANFRTDYEFLGAWAVSGDADTGGNIGQHIVYASPGTVKAYRKTGKFPDGAVLVKELFKGKTEDLTTGSATSAAEVAGYFVMVKDAEGKNTGPLWGDGWGWAFFGADDKKQTTTKDYKAECLACHEPVRDSDLIYSYAYPVLKP